MKILGVIPARYASTRFPGKPLIDIAGKTMIQRVYEQACKVKSLADIIVATDDGRIYNHVISFGGKAVMTAAHHQNGTERCHEVAATLDCDVVVNIQGDEPFIDPIQIDQVAACFVEPGCDIATLAKKETDFAVVALPNVVKVVFNNNNEAMYFSRSTIPFGRNENSATEYYKHIGIYAYRKEILKQLVSLPQSRLESIEILEQLRWLENGYRIKISITEFESVSVDVPDDIKRLPI